MEEKKLLFDQAGHQDCGRLAEIFFAVASRFDI
jgi:hypothetical protein